MKISYDSEVDALYIELRDRGSGGVESRDIAPGLVGDYGSDGNLAGLEVLDATKILDESPDRVLIELAPHRRASAV